MLRVATLWYLFLSRLTGYAALCGTRGHVLQKPAHLARIFVRVVGIGLGVSRPGCQPKTVLYRYKTAYMLPLQQIIQFSDYSELYDMIIPSDNLPRWTNDLEHELGYTKALLVVVDSNLSLAEVPEIKERLNILKEVLSHYVTSKDEDVKLGHKSEHYSVSSYRIRIQTRSSISSQTFQGRCPYHL